MNLRGASSLITAKPASVFARGLLFIFPALHWRVVHRSIRRVLSAGLRIHRSSGQWVAEQIYIASGHAVDLPCLGTSAAATNRHSAFFFRRILSFQWAAPPLTKVQVLPARCYFDFSLPRPGLFHTTVHTTGVQSMPDLPDVDLWSVFCWSKYDTIQLFFNLRQTPLALFVLSKKMVKSTTYRLATDHSTGPLALAYGAPFESEFDSIESIESIDSIEVRWRWSGCEEHCLVWRIWEKSIASFVVRVSFFVGAVCSSCVVWVTFSMLTLKPLRKSFAVQNEDHGWSRKSVAESEGGLGRCKKFGGAGVQAKRAALTWTSKSKWNFGFTVRSYRVRRKRRGRFPDLGHPPENRQFWRPLVERLLAVRACCEQFLGRSMRNDGCALATSADTVKASFSQSLGPS